MYLMTCFSADILLKFYSITNNAMQNIFVQRSFYTYASIL